MADNRTVSEDKKILHEMGYAQELSRSMSKFSNFAISFSIICILSGGINSFAQATSSIGGAGAGIGWIVGCLISGMFALAMAQISSAFPTAGGLYHWSSIFGNRFWGYLTAWLNLLGLITVLGAINIGTAFFFAGAFGGNMGFTGTAGQVVTFVAIITIIQAALNHFGIKLTAMLTDFSGYLILVTTAVLILACLAFAPSIDISRLWTFTNYSGEAGGNVFPQSDSMGYLFLLCLLLPVYTITGYDASAHTSEETVNASTSVPKSIVSAVVWSSLIGWLMLSAITLAIPDMAAGAKQGWGVFFETMNAVMPGWLKQLLYLGILAAQFLCGLATVTSASRMLFAFSRDGGMPVGSQALSTVSTEYRTPVNAIWTSAALTILYVFLAQFISIGGTNLYTIVVNSTLVFLFLSFIIPLVLGALAYGTAKWPKAGPWAMSEGLYKLVTGLSVIGMAIITYIAVQPPNEKVLWVVLGFIALAIVLWYLFEKNRFKGPPMGDEIKRRQAEIATREARFGEATVSSGGVSTGTIAAAATAAVATAAVAKAAAPSWTPPAVDKVRDVVGSGTTAAPKVSAPVVATPFVAAPVAKAPVVTSPAVTAPVGTPVRVAAPVVAKTATAAKDSAVKAKTVATKPAAKKVVAKKAAVKTVKRVAPTAKTTVKRAAAAPKTVTRTAVKTTVKATAKRSAGVATRTRDTSDEAARARILKAARRGNKGPNAPVSRPVTTTIRRPARDDEKAQSRVASTRDLKASSSRTEDITLISGVGEVLKKRLATEGITTLSQVAAMSKGQIAALDAKLNFRGRTEREEWIAQAKELVAGEKPRAKSDRNRT